MVYLLSTYCLTILYQRLSKCSTVEQSYNNNDREDLPISIISQDR